MTDAEKAARYDALFQAAHRLVANTRTVPNEIDVLSVRPSDWSDLDEAVTRCQQARCREPARQYECIRSDPEFLERT